MTGRQVEIIEPEGTLDASQATDSAALTLVALRQGDASPLCEKSTTEVLEAAERHRVPIVAARCLLELSEGELRESVNRRLRTLVLEKLQRDGAARRALVLLREVLLDLDIPAVLLKGASLDFDNDRYMRDLDVLVPPGATLRLLKELEARGWKDISQRVNKLIRKREIGDHEGQLEWNNQFQVLDPDSEALVELHTMVFERSRSHDLDLDAFLDQGDRLLEKAIEDPRISFPVLRLEHRLAIACAYASIRYSPARNNAVLRAHLDTVQLCRRISDWSGFQEEVAALHLDYHAAFGLLAADELFGEGAPPEVVTKIKARLGRGEKLMLRLHLACLRAPMEVTTPSKVVYRFLTPFLLGSRWSDRLKWLFLTPLLLPPRRKLARKYGVSEESPWLPLLYVVNPFRQILRAVGAVFRRGPR